MCVRALFITSSLFLPLLLLLSAPSAADQSSCRVIWIFKLNCAEPLGALVNQVKAWSSKKCRDSQEKCMYELVKDTPISLEIKHTSPSSRKTSTITFEFNPPSAPSFCRVKATSTAQGHNITSPNDYCLLYNLMDGSGLTEAPGYREISNEAMCPAKKTEKCS